MDLGVVAQITGGAIGMVVIPTVLWGIVVLAAVVKGRWRGVTFFVAVAVGGVGLAIDISVLVIVPADPNIGEGLAAGLAIMGGGLLLLIGAFMGFVSAFLTDKPNVEVEEEE